MEAPDLYYTDASWTDRGTISEGVLDLAYGDDENDFELTVDLTANYPLANGSLIYAEGTDIGGMVDEVEPDTIDGTCAWRGRTWHGILAGNIVAPDAGQDYWTAQGDANAVLRSLVSRLGLGELFAGASGASGITVDHDFRYVDAYQGVRDMLAKVGAKLHIAFDSARRRAVLSAEPISDDTADDEWDGDVMDVRIVCDWRPVNHLVCLGKGELKDRLVVHWYADEDGNVSATQTIFGSRHVAAVYDYSNAEKKDLEKEGKKKLEEMQDADEVSVSIPDGSLYDIGDRVGGRESHTGIFVTATVVKKIVHIRDGEMSVEYEAGMASTTGELHLDAEHTSVTGAQLSQVVEAVNTSVGEVRKAAAAAQSTADDATVTAYDHSYVLADGVYRFAAHVYRGGTEVTDGYEDEFFAWYLKTEDGETYLGEGPVIDVPASSAGFRASVVGELLDAAAFTLVASDGDEITGADGEPLAAWIERKD